MFKPLYCCVFFSVLLLAWQCVGFWGSATTEEQEHLHDEHVHKDEDEEFVEVVTCGSIIKLKHMATGNRLHSHEVNYGSGSGQQSVTAVLQADDPNSFWILRGPHGGHCRQGEPIKHGQVLRLQHLNTRRNLHSHLHQSPLSRHQEVSCFGENGDGDISDNWMLETENGKPGDIWQRKAVFVLRHVDTALYLHSHDVKYNRPIAGQCEVTAINKGTNSRWIVAEGVFFPPLVEQANKNGAE